MHLLFFILKKVDLMEDVLKHLAEHNITGGTILEGVGMAEALVNMEDLPLFGILRKALAGEEREICKIMLFVLPDEKIAETRKIINETVSLSEPNSGILFSVPLSFVEGLGDQTWN